MPSVRDLGVRDLGVRDLGVPEPREMVCDGARRGVMAQE
jgi:hypothetical protein